MRRAGLGLAAVLMGCAQPQASPPAPIVNVTVIIPPAQPEPLEVARQAIEEQERSQAAVPLPDANLPGLWPAWGWRVTVCPKRWWSEDQCRPNGPPLEFEQQCKDLLRVVEQARPGDFTGCSWVPIVPRERDPDYRVL